jgi:hypothetical protein
MKEEFASGCRFIDNDTFVRIAVDGQDRIGIRSLE